MDELKGEFGGLCMLDDEALRDLSTEQTPLDADLKLTEKGLLQQRQRASWREKLSFESVWSKGFSQVMELCIRDSIKISIKQSPDNLQLGTGASVWDIVITIHLSLLPYIS